MTVDVRVGVAAAVDVRVGVGATVVGDGAGAVGVAVGGTGVSVGVAGTASGTFVAGGVALAMAVVDAFVAVALARTVAVVTWVVVAVPVGGLAGPAAANEVGGPAGGDEPSPPANAVIAMPPPIAPSAASPRTEFRNFVCRKNWVSVFGPRGSRSTTVGGTTRVAANGGVTAGGGVAASGRMTAGGGVAAICGMTAIGGVTETAATASGVNCIATTVGDKPPSDSMNAPAFAGRVDASFANAARTALSIAPPTLSGGGTSWMCLRRRANIELAVKGGLPDSNS